MKFDEIDFIVKYMPKYEQKNFKQYIKSLTLALQINDDIDFVKEAVDNFIKKYPFTKKYIDEVFNNN